MSYISIPPPLYWISNGEQDITERDRISSNKKVYFGARTTSTDHSVRPRARGVRMPMRSFQLARGASNPPRNMCIKTGIKQFEASKKN